MNIQAELEAAGEMQSEAARILMVDDTPGRPVHAFRLLDFKGIAQRP